MQTKSKSPLLDANLAKVHSECPVCPFKDDLDIVVGHLFETHNYSYRVVTEFIDCEWENLKEASVCRHHGPYDPFQGCYPCYHIDRQIDERREQT